MDEVNILIKPGDVAETALYASATDDEGSFSRCEHSFRKGKNSARCRKMLLDQMVGSSQIRTIAL